MGRFRMISYAGCGFNGAYYLGVNKVLLSNLPKFIEKEPLYAGVSAGSISASSAAVFGLRNDDYELDFVKNFRAKAAKTRFSNELKHVLRGTSKKKFRLSNLISKNYSMSTSQLMLMRYALEEFILGLRKCPGSIQNSVFTRSLSSSRVLIARRSLSTRFWHHVLFLTGQELFL